MLRFLALLFLLIPSIAKSQAMNKVDMITEFSDVATLIAAEILQCGETDKDRVLAFNGIFDSFMLYAAEQEGVDLTQQDIEAYKLGILMQQYEGMMVAHANQGCDSINKIIDMYDERMHYATSVYDYYTPLKGI